MNNVNSTLRRSILFVSALALEDMPAAVESAADTVCIDLEDAVPSSQKASARAAVLKTLISLNASERARVVVRINSLRTLAGIADIQEFLACDPFPSALILPKVETGDEMRLAAALADDAQKTEAQFLGIIETNSGLENCWEIAAATPRLVGMIFGGFDMSTALGSDMGWEPLLYARARVVHAAAASGLQIIDSPFPGITDQSGLREAAVKARALGMTGKAAKHASQIDLINEQFTPSAAEILYAQRVVAAFEEDPARPLVIDGKLVELPTVKRLRRFVELPLPR